MVEVRLKITTNSGGATIGAVELQRSQSKMKITYLYMQYFFEMLYIISKSYNKLNFTVRNKFYIVKTLKIL